ncbi:MAG: hypothetical protein QOF48_3278 [Verrucomicrobiota bacterium]|jgi:hypothetical protein
MARCDLNTGFGHCSRGITDFSEPLHSERVIVDTAQVNIRGHLPVLQSPVELLWSRFRHPQAADTVEVFVLGDIPAAPRFSCLLRHDALHDILPCSCPEFRIRAVHIHPRQRQIHVRLRLRFIPSLEEAQGLVPVVSLEARSGVLLTVQVTVQVNDF